MHSFKSSLLTSLPIDNFSPFHATCPENLTNQDLVIFLISDKENNHKAIHDVTVSASCYYLLVTTLCFPQHRVLLVLFWYRTFYTHEINNSPVPIFGNLG
jgi:hypothetical protein